MTDALRSNLMFSSTERVALFAHYDCHDEIAEYVVRYVRLLNETGFRVIFVSTACISDEDALRLKAHCDMVLLRPNTGHDFGSWAYGYRQYSGIPEFLLLVNDSVFGPVGDLRLTLETLTRLPADAYGMVASAEHGWHLQSWFLLLTPQAQQSRSFKALMATDFDALDRAGVITHGELGLSKGLLSEGLTLQALFDASDVNPMMRAHPCNPTHWMWRSLLTRFKVPFVKIDLLRNNALHIPDVSEWKSAIGRRDPELARMMAAHLERSTPRREPQTPSAGGRLLIRLRYICCNAPDGPVGGLILLLWNSVSRLANAVIRMRRRQDDVGRSGPDHAERR